HFTCLTFRWRMKFEALKTVGDGDLKNAAKANKFKKGFGVVDIFMEIFMTSLRRLNLTE
ncbi:unnamed protein product, partial [Ceratitis capitata]